MSTFSHGWQRKAGCVTLVMALGFTGAWIKSLRFRDVISDRPTDSSMIAFRSFEGGLGWERFDHAIMAPPVPTGWISEYDFKFSIFDPWWRFDNFEDDEIVWIWEWAGFSCGVTEKTEPSLVKRRLDLWIIPYWAIIWPLTLLSVYLLLWPGTRLERHVKPPPD